MTRAAPSRKKAAPVFAAVAAAALASACASAPPESFYTLNAGLRPRVDDVARREGPRVSDPPLRALGVLVAPAAVPALVDRPQLVLRAGENQVIWLEQQRWAEPLGAQMSRVVAEDLEALLAGWRIATRDEALPAPECRVTLDVRRFEMSRAGPAVSDVLWRVACAGGFARTGQLGSSEPVGYPIAGDALAPAVAAHARVLDRLSREIAQALREAAP